jgi:hypothetical protein
LLFRRALDLEAEMASKPDARGRFWGAEDSDDDDDRSDDDSQDAGAAAGAAAGAITIFR